jgi:GNAT superfamily N-acetyltransferase
VDWNWRLQFLEGGGSAPSRLVFDALERRMWIDLWRAPVLDAIEEERIELRRYGPVQAMAAGGFEGSAMLNLVLGATEEGAAGGGHLEDALEWMESLDVDFRIPIASDSAESAAAEDLLNRRGYERTESRVRFVRDASPPTFRPAPGVSVYEHEAFAEGFGDTMAEAFELDPLAACFFDCLPGRDYWRCYTATDPQERGLGCAAMLLHYEVAHFAFAATDEASRGCGCHMALLHRRIKDAAAAGCAVMVAETIEPASPREASTGCCNLVRAGFKQASVRTAWAPPPR